MRRDAKAWMVGFAVELSTPSLREIVRAVGIDLGISTFAALSDGGAIPSLKAARCAQRRLRTAQRALARKTRGSKGRGKARTAVRRCHAAIARRRANHLHQASARLVRDYEGRYGAARGLATADAFVETAYRSLKGSSK